MQKKYNSNVANFFQRLKINNVDALVFLLKFNDFDLSLNVTNDLNNLEFELLSQSGLVKLRKAINIYIAAFKKFKKFDFNELNIDRFKAVEQGLAIEFINRTPFFIQNNILGEKDFFSWHSNEFKAYYSEYNKLNKSQQIAYDQVIFNHLISSLDDNFKDFILKKFKIDFNNLAEQKESVLNFMQNMSSIYYALAHHGFSANKTDLFYSLAEKDLLINQSFLKEFKYIDVNHLILKDKDLAFKF